MLADKEKSAENTLCILKGFVTQYGGISARQNRVCPCQSTLRNAHHKFAVNSFDIFRRPEKQDPLP